jgi:hypothetical protein
VIVSSEAKFVMPLLVRLTSERLRRIFCDCGRSSLVKMLISAGFLAPEGYFISWETKIERSRGTLRESGSKLGWR